jgi:hypothetical protein
MARRQSTSDVDNAEMASLFYQHLFDDIALSVQVQLSSGKQSIDNSRLEYFS